MADTDFYSTLGISKSASQDEIKRAYRKLAKENHPDMNPGSREAEERFKAVNAAFDVLSDPKKRELYDEFGADGLRDGFDPDQARAYQRWSSRGAGPDGVRFTTGNPGGGGFDYDDLSSIFGDVFGGGFGGGGFRSGAQAGPRRGTDVEAGVTVDFLTAVRGGEVSLRLNGASSETLNVRIPPGISEGGKLRLAGKGQPGINGGPAGDLLLSVNVAPHPSLRREDKDLYMDLPVTVGEALLGARVTLPTPDGSSVTMAIPKRSQNGSKLRLKGKGVPDVKGGHPGDLYVILDVRLPSSDDGEVDELARSLETHYRDEANRPTRL